MQVTRIPADVNAASFGVWGAFCDTDAAVRYMRCMDGEFCCKIHHGSSSGSSMWIVQRDSFGNVFANPIPREEMWGKDEPDLLGWTRQMGMNAA